MNSTDYSDKGSFGAAFQAAHNNVGPGHTFTYNGKSYSTDCKDGGNYRGEMPNPSGWYDQGWVRGYSATDVSDTHVPDFSDHVTAAIDGLPMYFNRDFRHGYAQGVRDGYNMTNEGAKARPAAN